MQWSEAVEAALAQVPETFSLDLPLARRLYALVDLTSLNDTDTDASIASFMQAARSPLGEVAAVCVYPRFVSLVATEFAGSTVQTATVVNFPSGDEPLDHVLVEINQALQDGANEIDVVFPYLRYLAGERQYAQSFVAACKAACGEGVLLKVILETGALQDPAIIADAAYDALVNGADFVKTSTGKIAEGASLAAAAVMLLVVKHMQPKVQRPLGVKVSGGIRTADDAARYVALADQILGKDKVSATTFRIGASQLVQVLLNLARM
jgi:deoxyribose-phosphate aldolase